MSSARQGVAVEDSVLLGYDVASLCNKFLAISKEQAAFIFKSLEFLKEMCELLKGA